MKKVVCINDKKLPPGTEIVEGAREEESEAVMAMLGTFD